MTTNWYQIKSLKAFWLGSPNYTNLQNGTNAYSVDCFTPNQITQFTNQSSVNILPFNCGFAAFNLSSTDGDYSQATFAQTDLTQDYKISQFCVACQPGFKPTFMNPLLNHIVTQCTPISNCSALPGDFGQVFNICGQCNSGFVFGMDLT